MIKKIINMFKDLEKTTLSIMKNGIKFCFLISIISSFLLLTYTFIYTEPNIYYIGLSLFKLSLFFIIDFIICGFVVDNIKKQII